MHRVISVKPLANYLVRLSFSDGTHKEVDLHPYIGKGIAAALKDETYFHKVAVEEGGGIFWPNGYDFCPNFLYDELPAVDLTTA